MDTQTLYSLLVPLVFVVIGVLASRLGRRDNDSSPMRNHFAVATSVILMSLATAISDLGLGGALDSYILVWILGYLVLLWISVDFDRFSSWERDESGLPTDRKNLWKGIIGPNTVAVGAFFLYRVNS